MKDEIVICFYDRFSYDIAQVKTVAQKVDVLSRMEESFRQAVRSNPSIRNELSEVYQQLKIECEHVA